MSPPTPIYSHSTHQPYRELEVETNGNLQFTNAQTEGFLLQIKCRVQ